MKTTALVLTRAAKKEISKRIQNKLGKCYRLV